MEIIKSGDFTKYLAEKVHQTNDPDETFEQKLSSALITIGTVKSGEQLISYEQWFEFIRGGAEVYVAAAQVILEKKVRERLDHSLLKRLSMVMKV